MHTSERHVKEERFILWLLLDKCCGFIGLKCGGIAFLNDEFAIPTPVQFAVF